MKTSKSTEINGYVVDLETDMDSHGPDSPQRVTGCWITKANFSGSLSCLLNTGKLYGDYGGMSVPDDTINKIEAWAIENGY